MKRCADLRWRIDQWQQQRSNPTQELEGIVFHTKELRDFSDRALRAHRDFCRKSGDSRSVVGVSQLYPHFHDPEKRDK